MTNQELLEQIKDIEEEQTKFLQDYIDEKLQMYFGSIVGLLEAIVKQLGR